MILHDFLHAWDQSRYNPIWLQLGQDEHDIQNALLEKMKYRGLIAWPVDVGAKELRGRAVGLARRMGATRLQMAKMNKGKTGAGFIGLVDVNGIQPAKPWGRPIYIEVKRPAWLEISPRTGRLIQRRPPGLPTLEQLAFLETMHRQGAIVGVAWSPDDLDLILPPTNTER